MIVRETLQASVAENNTSIAKNYDNKSSTRLTEIQKNIKDQEVLQAMCELVSTEDLKEDPTNIDCTRAVVQDMAI